MNEHMATNVAPWPETLSVLVDSLSYKQNWHITLENLDRGQGSVGLTLCILITTPNSYAPHELRRVMHYMPVPPAAYDMRSWRRWLLEQIMIVERHEACEFFEIDGVKPYAPSHGPGNDPYLIREVGTIEDVETSFRGERKTAK